MRSNKSRVLIVDDSRAQRITIIEWLKILGYYDLIEAENGRQALDLIESSIEPIDIVFTDLAMPVVDGVDFLQNLFKRKFYPAVIIMSSFDTSILSSIEVMSEEAGRTIIGSLPKPIDRTLFLKLLNKAEKFIADKKSNLSTPLPKNIAFSTEEIKNAFQAGQFEVWFQPIYRMHGDGICGAEALLRWRHPEQGILLPGAFLPQIENTEFMHEISRWILADVCMQQQIWIGMQQELFCNVNLAAINFEDANLVDDLAQIVKDFEIPAECITLLFTENSLQIPNSATLTSLSRLRLKKFKLAINHFGSEFNALDQLARLPISKLIIDRNMVKDVQNSEKQRIFLESTQKLAYKLGLQVIFEGVETDEEWNVIRNFKESYLQGFLRAMPMSGTEFSGFLVSSDPFPFKANLDSKQI